MSGELKKMKPRAVQGSAEQRLRTIAVVMVLCLLVIIGIVVIIGPGKSNKGGITAQTGQQASSAQSAPSSSGIESIAVPPLSVYRGRNVFKPLVRTDYTGVSAPAAPAAPGAAGGAATGSGRVLTLPAELDVTGTQAGSVVSIAITLEGIFEQDGQKYARISVGDNLFEKVAVGEVFATNYKLLALGEDSSASILYGDERFSIYTGQSLYW